MREFGASGKPTEAAAYADSAAGTAARLLILRPPQVNSRFLLELPKNWPVPDSLPKPLTLKIWAEEGVRILDQGRGGGETLRSRFAYEQMTVTRGMKYV